MLPVDINALYFLQRVDHFQQVWMWLSNFKYSYVKHKPTHIKNVFFVILQPYTSLDKMDKLYSAFGKSLCT
jgi:hypothetical protein